MSSKFEIVEAAMRLLESGGLDAVTVRSVAEASFYGRSSVTHHFGDKEGLLDALHLCAIEAYVLHLHSAKLVKLSAANAHTRFMDQIWGGTTAPSAEPETSSSLVERFRLERPGSWELMRFRRCPEFGEAEAPMAWEYIHRATGGDLCGASAGRTVDLIVHQVFALHEWAQEITPRNAIRLVENPPSVPYWINVFDLDVL